MRHLTRPALLLGALLAVAIVAVVLLLPPTETRLPDPIYYV